ncbi:hypothetical protein TMatcc_006776 [Talaromyces marneffei ATCC 18224]|uniref:Zeaxanthin epoxidase, chloroplastic n=1 Tax=Talaromyces marneffei PM1 TaxID=1077442 RepID=A0A093XRU1_TALMA|nr:uncharacterized protein EYB26_003799 [Talaromyces marneffei]KAE8553770.1 hypothetical protein EYB25_005152 [Talaromyces marneffei]QGA16132.1 hypothetical protein EYB26_003799 [Talaromyces marneffei]
MGDQAETTAKAPKVAIIGAGLTGLLAAQGLKKRGFQVAVFDCESGIDSRPRDWTIVLHWALPTLGELLDDDVRNELPKAICNPYLDFNDDVECLPCYNGNTGELLFKSALPGSRRVSRQRLRKVLSQGIDVKWSKRLVELKFLSDNNNECTDEESPVQLLFDDGAIDIADFVLAADGASSTIRELLLGPEAARVQLAGLMFATGVTHYHDADKVAAVVKAHPVAAITLGMESIAGCGVLHVEDQADMSTWTTFWTKIWRGSSADMPKDQSMVEYIKDTTKDLCEPFQSLVDWTPPESACYIDEMKYWVPVSFDNHAGRVTLVGDAAHPMLPFRGQGYQHAITDIKNYVDALVRIKCAPKTSDRKEMMSAFDSEMIERTGKAVKQSVQEAEYSMNMETVGKMLMATHGHGRSA